MHLTEKDVRRFWDLVAIGEPGECWNIRNKAGSSGYVHLNFRGIQIDSHRIAYIAKNGPIPEGFDVHHTCPVRNKRCCNPAHLEIRTPAEHAREPGHVANIHASKTHCPRGHEYTTANTYTTTQNRRMCRECQRIRRKQRRIGK